MPARAATPLDAGDIIALFHAIEADSVADYGSFGRMPDGTSLQQMMASPTAAFSVFYQGATLRGALYCRMEEGVWHVQLVATDATMTALQRLGVFAAMVRFWVGTLPDGAPVEGVVRVGRRLDLALNGLLSVRALDSPTMARYHMTKEELATKFVAMAAGAP
mgnify:CR=1 FL=1